MKRNNTKYILPNFIYDSKTLVVILRVHKNTVRRWQKEGLSTLDSSGLFLGSEVKEFLVQKKKKQKIKLKPCEFYCPKCKKASVSEKAKLEFVKTGKLLPSGACQIIVKGVCRDCGKRINRFESSKTIENFLLLSKQEV